MDSSLKPLVIFSEIFGLRTFNIVKEGNEIHFEKRKRGVFYYIRVALCFVALIFATVHKGKKQFGPSKSVIISFVKVVHLNCRVPLVVVCYFLGNYQAETIVDFLNSMVKVHPTIERMGAKINYKYARNVAYIMISANSFKLMLHFIPYLIKDNWSFTDCLYGIVFSVPDVIIHCITMQWITYLCLLRLEFRSLNKVLLKLKSICFRCDEEDGRIRNRNLPVFIRNVNVKEPSSTIRNTSQIFNILCDQANQINKAFVWQLFVIIFWLFIATTNNSFIIFQMIRNSLNFNIRHVFLDGLHMLSFFEIVLPCIMVKDEVNKMIDTLQFINMNEHTDSGLSQMINALILQTHHQIIEFSILGTLQLDGTLIYSIFGALTTYLVILLQFDIKY